MAETESNTMETLRYCGIPTCENSRGTTDKNIAFFRFPEKGSVQRKVWAIMLCANPGVKMYFENCHELCQLHFKPTDVQLKMHDGQPIYELKEGAAPLPLKFDAALKACQQKVVILKNRKPIRTLNADIVPLPSGNGAESTINGVGEAEFMPDVKFIDVNEFRNIPSDVDVKTEIILNDEIQPSSPINELDDSIACSKCNQFAIQLQRANSKISDLEKQVIVLKLKIADLQKSTKKATSAAVQLKQRPKIVAKMHENLAFTIANPKPDVMHNNMNPLNISNNSTVQGSSPKIIKITSAVKARLELDKKLFTCKKCQMSFTSMKQLVEHLRKVNHHLDDRVTFECFVCKRYKIKTESFMRNHIKRCGVKRIRKSKCLICRQPLAIAELDSHLCGDNADVQCEYCADRFTVTKVLREHLENVHKSNRRLYKCKTPLCKKYFPMIFLKECHESVHDPESEEVLACDTCGKQFSSQLSLTGHKKVHRKTTSFLCDLCGKNFKSAQSLADHKKYSSIHSEQRIQCPDCPKRFHDYHHFNRHVSRVHANNKCLCDICGKWLSSTEGHRVHMLRHTRTEADRRFACKICPLKFFRKNDLTKHQYTHNAVKKFYCRFCSQSYKYSGDLNKHLRTHLGDKIHECTKCSMRFQYPTELQKHLFEHYGEEKAAESNVGIN